MCAVKFKEVDDYSSFRADRLMVGKRIPFDIFVKSGNSLKPLFTSGTTFTNIARDLLAEKGVSNVFIKKAEGSAAEQYIASAKEAASGDRVKDFKDYSFHKNTHYRVERASLAPGTTIDFSLYLLDKMRFDPLVEATGKSPAKLDESVLAAGGDILIRNSDIPRYLAYLNSLANAGSVPGREKTGLKTHAFREGLKVVLKDALDDPGNSKKISAVKAHIGKLVDLVFQDKEVISDLISLRTYDYYTYIHSVNVAVLSVGLANSIGMEQDAVRELGIGAIFHDIGKTAVSPEIFNKVDLNLTERLTMEGHVIEGEKLLRQSRDIPEASFRAVSQHHEKLTGKGYPRRLAGREIGLFGRIAAIADFYDDLTTPRPFKYSLTPYYALLFISKETADFDRELILPFIKMFGKVQ